MARSPGVFASQDGFRDVLSNSGTPGNGFAGKDGHASGPYSEMSTSAGATPNLDDRSSPASPPWPPTPDSQRALQSPSARGGRGGTNLGSIGGDRRRGGGSNAGPGNNGGKAFAPGSAVSGGASSGMAAAGGPPPRHAGKVFVGGVPQDMSQDDMFQIFSTYGGIKKAWLQSYRTAGRINQSPPHNHRGFGFVIFFDGSSVDNLLGNSFSKYLPLPDGRRLEIKRAVPSSDLPGKPEAGTLPLPSALAPERRFGPGGRSYGGRGAGSMQEPVRQPAAAGVPQPPAPYQMPPQQPVPGPWPNSAVPGQPVWPGYMPGYMAQQGMPQHQQQLLGQPLPQQQPHGGMIMAQMPYGGGGTYSQHIGPHGGLPQAHPGLPQHRPQGQPQGQQQPQYYVAMPNMPIVSGHPGNQAAPAASQQAQASTFPQAWHSM